MRGIFTVYCERWAGSPTAGWRVRATLDDGVAGEGHAGWRERWVRAMLDDGGGSGWLLLSWGVSRTLAYDISRLRLVCEPALRVMILYNTVRHTAVTGGGGRGSSTRRPWHDSHIMLSYEAMQQTYWEIHQMKWMPYNVNVTLTVSLTSLTFIHVNSIMRAWGLTWGVSPGGRRGSCGRLLPSESTNFFFLVQSKILFLQLMCYNQES